MADITTFGVVYGTPITAADLKAILDAHDAVEINGQVIVDSTTTTCISANSNLVVTGAGSIESANSLLIEGAAYWGVDVACAGYLHLNLASTEIKGCDLTGGGWLVESCDIGGAGSDRVTVTGGVRANGSNNRINADFDAVESNVCFKFGGGFNRADVAYNENEWKSSVGNDLRGSTFTGGIEECCGFDAMNAGLVEGWGTCTRSGNNITVTVIGSHQTMQTGSLVDTLNGPYSAVGAHVLVLTGDAAGNYYAITAQDGHTLTLDTSKFPASGIADGDHVLFGSAHVENNWSGITVNQNAQHRPTHQEVGTWEFYGFEEDGEDPVTNSFHVGLNFFGYAFGNIVEDGTFTYTGSGGYSVGIGDNSFAHKLTAGAGTVDRSLYSWKLNSRNTYRRNNVVGFSQDFQCSTTMYTMPEWEGRPIQSVPDEFRGFGIVAEDNSFDPPNGIAYMTNVRNVVWRNNGVELQTVNTGQIPVYLGSDMVGDTTFAPLKKLKLIGGHIKIHGGKIKVR